MLEKWTTVIHRGAAGQKVGKTATSFDDGRSGHFVSSRSQCHCVQEQFSFDGIGFLCILLSTEYINLFARIRVKNEIESFARNFQFFTRLSCDFDLSHVATPLRNPVSHYCCLKHKQK